VHGPDNRGHQDSSTQQNGTSTPKARAAILPPKTVRNQQKKAH
jgi:hypothetical protein